MHTSKRRSKENHAESRDRDREIFKESRLAVWPVINLLLTLGNSESTGAQRKNDDTSALAHARKRAQLVFVFSFGCISGNPERASDNWLL